MVQGFNHNIKHKGKLFHIQTEDSGRDNPHIITHVFVGGNILASKKTSYADIVKADRLESIVKELMEEQHKSVLRNLINGVYDDPDRTVPGAPARESSAPKPAGAPARESSAPKAPGTPKVPVSAGVVPPSLSAVEPPTWPPGRPAAPSANTPKPVPKPMPPKPGAPPPGAGERSLDEIILSYLADREE